MTEQKPFDASDFVNLTLSSIPSTFGRLAALAGLRDGDNDPLADGLYGKEHIDEALRQRHRDTLFAWLCLSQAAQVEEVAEYLADQAGKQDAAIGPLVRRWAREKLYEELMPTGASETERKFFSSDLRAILQILQIKLSYIEGNHGG